MTKSDPRTQNDQPPPIADLSTFPEAVNGDWTHDELFRLCMVEYPRRLHAATPIERRLILSRRPPLTGTIWDAAIAASIEHGALIHDLRPPEWTDEEHRFLDEPVELLPQTANTVLCHLPAPFTRHGIIMDPQNLDRRAGNEQWIPETGDPDERWPRTDSPDADRARVRRILYIDKPTSQPEPDRSSLYNACASMETMAARRGWVFRIALGNNSPPTVFVLRGANTPNAKIRKLQQDKARELVLKALHEVGLQESDWHELLKTTSRGINTRRVPPRTVWNRPGLTIAGVTEGIRRRWGEDRRTNSERS